MNLKQIQYFIHVADLGSFSRASQALGVAQPALSRQVRALEIELRDTLLLRNGRGVQPTEAGLRLLEHGRGILQMVNLARHELDSQRDEPTGRVTIGMPPSLARRLTLPLLERFSQELPKARFALVEGFSAHVGEWLVAGRVDVGLLYNPERQAALDIKPLMRDRLMLVGPPERGSKKPTAGAAVKFSQLVRLPLVMPEPNHIFRKLLESQAMIAGVQLNVVQELSSVPAIVDVVRAGHGHAVLAASAVRAFDQGPPLTCLPIESPELHLLLCQAQSAQRRSTPLVQRTALLLERLALEMADDASDSLHKPA